MGVESQLLHPFHWSLLVASPEISESEPPSAISEILFSKWCIKKENLLNERKKAKKEPPLDLYKKDN
jgi:hypothetical protein